MLPKNKSASFPKWSPNILILLNEPIFSSDSDVDGLPGHCWRLFLLSHRQRAQQHFYVRLSAVHIRNVHIPPSYKETRHSWYLSIFVVDVSQEIKCIYGRYDITSNLSYLSINRHCINRSNNSNHMGTLDKEANWSHWNCIACVIIRISLERRSCHSLKNTRKE